MKILQIANYSDTGGGISVQVKLLQQKITQEGFVCDIISTKGNLWQRLKALFHLLSIGQGYDVFHVHACSGIGFFPAIVGISIGRLFKRRIVLTYHGGEAELFFKKRTCLVKHFLKKTNVNIALSGFIGRVFEQYQIPYIIIPNIVELDENHFRERQIITPTIISTRALEDTYNIGCTIRAFQLLQNKYPNAQLTIVGDGSKYKQLVSFVKENSLINVTFTGRVSNDIVYSYLNKADILVSSSRIDNMPVSVLEGFNAGLLVIASRVGGVPYLIENGVNGLLFESENDHELAEKMIWAINNPSCSIDMIHIARKRIKEYSWESIKNKLFPVYQYE